VTITPTFVSVSNTTRKCQFLANVLSEQFVILNNKELCELKRSSSIVPTAIYKLIRWATNVARMERERERRNAYRNVTRQPLGKCSLVGQRSREDGIKKDLKQIV
jgi:hypothetical protein